MAEINTPQGLIIGLVVPAEPADDKPDDENPAPKKRGPRKK